jgi:glycosyltransferase involved in cell wall biosynthesis
VAHVIVVTPATRFGSWSWIEKALERSPDVRAVVVGYGRAPSAPANIRFVSLPAVVDYAAVAPKLAERRFLALNALYYAPLVPLAWWAVLRYRPRVLLANGVNAAMLLGPLTRLGPRLVLAFHGSVEHAGLGWHRILRRSLRPVDVAFVNSRGSADDLAHVLERSRIVVVDTWADPVFFETPLEREPSSRLRVLYVGRLDDEKFAQCLRVCGGLAAAGVVDFRVVGAGPLEERARALGAEVLGYVSDKRALARIYAEADVVWAPADVTYLSLPGAEALAAGCPIVVSATPAVSSHAARGLKVPRDLVPETVGLVVDDDDEAAAVLRRWRADGISVETRIACRTRATEYHSAANLDPVLTALRSSAPSR